ncbi:MAG TPA: hypothetical protein V6D17_10350 [Candidatus Obscuribacterales bacterium]
MFLSANSLSVLSAAINVQYLYRHASVSSPQEFRADLPDGSAVSFDKSGNVKEMRYSTGTSVSIHEREDKRTVLVRRPDGTYFMGVNDNQWFVLD